MYFVDSVEKKHIKKDPIVTMFVKPPENLIQECDRLEVWGSTFNEGNEDFCEFRLLIGDKIIWSQKVKGY